MYTAQKNLLHTLFRAALDAVAPDAAVRRHLRLAGDTLYADGAAYALARKNVVVLGAGKGAAPMAAAVEDLLGPRITDGLVVVKYAHGLPLRRIQLTEAAHPVPDAAGVAAAQALLRRAAQCDDATLALCVFTGGASALTPAPAAPLTLEDIQRTTQALLACGAAIDQINAVRKHLSCFSGGLLARACQPAQVLSLVVSDVIGDPLDVIASGPTVPDPTTFAQCTAIVDHFSLWSRLPPRVRARLEDGCAGRCTETPKPDDPLFGNVHTLCAATNRQALDAAASAAQQHGMTAVIISTALQGEARDAARWVVATAARHAACMHPDDPPLCLLAGGETTVTLRGQGSGGRNQEMALAAALALDAAGPYAAQQHRICALFASTDGTDGPTDAAGGFALPDTAARLRPHGGGAHFLAENASYAALDACGDIFHTGPTRTNVMDVALCIVQPPQ